MTKKNDKRLCWNCEGSVSHHLSQCPYCGVDVTQPIQKDENALFKGYGSPFQTAPKQEIPEPPYAHAQPIEFTVTEEEWNSALNKEKEPIKEGAYFNKKECFAFFLLLPGIVFFLFALILIFFSSEGVLTLRWHQNMFYFYFLGSIPLLYLSWRAFRS